jgi:hypothetical protein
LIRDDDTAVYGDKGYASDAKKCAAQAAGVLCVNRLANLTRDRRPILTPLNDGSGR